MRFAILVLIPLLLGAILGAKPVTERTLFLSKTKKNQVDSFLARAASEKYHYVVTTAPIANAIQTVQLTERPQESLHLVEGANHGTSQGICLDQFCLVSAKPSQEFHGTIYTYAGTNEIKPSKDLVQIRKLSRTKSQELIEDVIPSADEASDHIAILTGEKAINPAGQTIRERQKDESKKLARQYLRQEYEKMGYKVEEISFSRGRGGVNLVAEKAGSEAGFVIVSAHYDTVRSPGADDDATGVATSLLVAKSLAGRNLRLGVKFVAFDLEEAGLIGSNEYASYLEKNGQMKNLQGVFQVEMTGYNPQGNSAIHVIDCDENTSAQLSQLIIESIRENGLPLKKVDACTDRSDHAVFWSYNRPAIVVSENFFGGEGNPCYHRACDQQKELDHKYLAQIAQAILGAVSRLVLP